MVCIQRPYYHFGVQRHIYISILEIPAHTHIYIYMYIYNYIYLYASGDQVVCAHKPYYSLYIYIYIYYIRLMRYFTSAK